MMTMITHIAFDLGGVLFAEGKIEVSKIFLEKGYDPEKISLI